MSYRYLVISLALGMCLMMAVALSTLPPSQADTSEGLAASEPGYTVDLVPDQMALAGEVTTNANCVDPVVCSWLDDTPMGSIMLGVDPGSPDTEDWSGGSATAEVFLTDVYSPTVLVLALSWPDRDGKGLHSPVENRTATITLDGRPLWAKRTTEISTFGDFYAAEHQPILTTIVVTQSTTHTLVISVPSATAWDLSQIRLTAYPYPGTIRGIGYSPLRDCQYPGGDLQPSADDIREDLFRLYHTSNAIRTYSSTGVSNQIPALANEIGLPVFAGAWLDDVPGDDEEVYALIDLACTTDLAGVIVGNEYYLRHRTADDIAYLVQRIEQVRNGIYSACGKYVPVTTAEIDNLMFYWESGSSTVTTGIKPVYRPVLDAVDWVMVHTYPFWNRLPIDGAASFTVQRYKAMQAVLEQEYPAQGKRLIIGEAGWPSGGAPNGAAVPSLAHQRRYLLELLNLAERSGVEFMYFDAFDELWKIEEAGGVGQRWGYSYTDRSAKHYFYGVLLPSVELFPNRIYVPLVSRGVTLAASHIPVNLQAAYDMPPDSAQVSSGAFSVYSEWLKERNGFVPSGFMGDIGSLSLYECDRTDPHGGELAIRASFSPTGTLGWGGIYWQHPEDNWGTLPGGKDLTGATRLTFWARGAEGNEVIEFFVGGLGEPTDPYSDTVRPSRGSGPIVLANTWQQFEIDLANADLERVIGGFAWVASRCHNDGPITFYLDDIAFDDTIDPQPLPVPARRPFYVYDDQDSGCNHFVASGWMGDQDDIVFDPSWTVDPFNGTTAISITYSALGTNGEGKAGIYWQEPENNWGDVDGGFGLGWANKLTFRAKGQQGGERVRFFVGGIGTKVNAYPDSLRPAASTGFVQLTDTWQDYTIDLREQDLRRVIGGFGWATDQCANPDGATFQLDSIAFDFDPAMPPPPPRGTVFPVYTDAAASDNHFVPTGWMGDANVPGLVSLSECWDVNPHSGQTAIRVDYVQEGDYSWAGVYWVDPAENWGDRPGGIDLTGADRLTFWGRSDTPNATIKGLIGGIGYPQGTYCSGPTEPYPDSVCPRIQETKTLSLSPTWTKYTIDLSQYPSRDLSGVVGGFGWIAEYPLVFYLDDIVYEFDE